MKIKKGKGKYWYREGNNKAVFNKCKCGNFKLKNSKKCYKCRGVSKKGFFKKKADNKKRGISGGYVYVYNPKHHTSNSMGYIREHILIAEKKIGRLIKKDEVVHHKNGNKQDNRPENLEVMSRTAHNTIHGYKKISNNKISLILKLKKENFSNRKIERIIHVSRKTIKKYLELNGIELTKWKRTKVKL